VGSVRGMTDWISAKEFHASEGVGDWRVLATYAAAHFRTGGYAAGVALVAAIGGLGEAEVVLRPGGVTVRLVTEAGKGFPVSHVELARRISAAAAAAGAVAEPAAVQDVQLTIDAIDIPRVRAFWRAVLGYEDLGAEDLVDPRGYGPSIWFQPQDAPRPQRNRIHVDVWVPADQTEARVAAAVAAGGTVVFDGHAPTSWTLADPEGNEADVATWFGRG
jgi:4a-hydroxytetrahydrobiopterin dehydratase